MVTMFIYSVEV